MQERFSDGAEQLLANARRWAGERRVIVLMSDGEEPNEDMETLFASWKQAYGLRIEFLDWKHLPAESPPPALAFLPLLVWDYVRAPVEYARMLQTLATSGAQPAGDLRACAWIMHKKYLLALSKSGVDVVPTELLEAGVHSARSLRAACRRLRAIAHHISDGCDGSTVPSGATCSGSSGLGGEAPRRGDFVWKPAVGGGGDGVERWDEDDESTLSMILRAVEERDHVLQPFLHEVSLRGELAFVFINGELLHAVRKEPRGWSAHVSQPITRLEPPPADAEATARYALQVACTHCGMQPTDVYLARVDLLPVSCRTSTEHAPFRAHAHSPQVSSQCVVGPRSNRTTRWLVSELELGWPHLFLRGDPTGGAAAKAASGLLHHTRSTLPRTLPATDG
jgi:hypothetical protein